VDKCPNHQVRLLATGMHTFPDVYNAAQNSNERGALRSNASYSETSGSEHSLLPPGAGYSDVPPVPAHRTFVVSLEAADTGS
jgi:hypothetical protein